GAPVPALALRASPHSSPITCLTRTHGPTTKAWRAFLARAGRAQGWATRRIILTGTRRRPSARSGHVHVQRIAAGGSALFRSLQARPGQRRTGGTDPRTPRAGLALWRELRDRAIRQDRRDGHHLQGPPDQGKRH